MDIDKMDHILHVLTNIEDFYKESAEGRLQPDQYSAYIYFFIH
ncbi:hypothetical protein SAMN05518856_103233 [Paenibacillus sp. OK003]|uniref:Uncharacterized protein n=1 Tax=Paenibacillus pabuli TaxID=1472 RepID=A0A855XWH4_9BACL|nr:hypothetical protein DET56_107285 [Paenibacillus pabuli]PXW06068.1 hypothetical protein DEU73_107285 [Paenibacillus taichungensis]SEK61973.1 hypothetical protein SAMN05518856_103233 [Paenibacillus sp. OK003]